MASSHTEACAAMRPGCDDEGVCDCEYLDSVMREGYQKDYSTPTGSPSGDAPDCPKCGSIDIRPGGSYLWCGNIHCDWNSSQSTPDKPVIEDCPLEFNKIQRDKFWGILATTKEPGYVCNCGQEFDHEYDRLIHASECESVSKPITAKSPLSLKSILFPLLFAVIGPLEKFVERHRGTTMDGCPYCGGAGYIPATLDLEGPTRQCDYCSREKEEATPQST